MTITNSTIEINGMTSKETAIKLVAKFRHHAESSGHGEGFPDFNTFNAKKCAIICVDEVVDALDLIQGGRTDTFWKSVKTEINNL